MSEQIPAGFVPYEDISDSGVQPDGAYQLRGVSMEPATTSTGKKMFRCVAQVELPEAQAGQQVYENFVIGNDNDPAAQLKETWTASVGARRWKGLLKAAAVPASTSEANLCAGFEGSVFCGVATTYTEKDGDYAGTMRNRWNFYKVGTYQPGVVAKKGAVGAVRAPAAPQPASFVPPMGGVPMPSLVPPVPTMSAPAPPVSAPPPGIMLPCGICGKQFSPGDFPTHVAQCLMQVQAGKPGAA